MVTPIYLVNQVLGDNFGFTVRFPTDPTGGKLVMTLKKDPSSAVADAQKTIDPIPTTPIDSELKYNVTIALTAAETALLSEGTYYFDIVQTDTAGIVSHILDPDSTVSFVASIT